MMLVAYGRKPYLYSSTLALGEPRDSGLADTGVLALLERMHDLSDRGESFLVWARHRCRGYQSSTATHQGAHCIVTEPQVHSRRKVRHLPVIALSVVIPGHSTARALSSATATPVHSLSFGTDMTSAWSCAATLAR
jgi:hypothetical protein